ncbi:hypothetical protein DPMN_082952 [Dreissena polymorpha]|uniref:Uncharacterized protein n=1 Tax=Dreissena polymorpha TaxID=45954 RepID=A0A9D3YBQ7_DREPO|nr:hypothetical protein DPMN_082952 [Dreissena polymorpha]
MVTWWLHGYDPRFLTERAEVQELSAKEDENQNSRASIREPVTNNISHMSIISLEQEMEKIKLQNGSTLPNGKTGSVSSIGGCRVSWGGDKTSQNEVKGILEVDSQSKYSNDHLVKKVNSGAEVKVDTDGCLTPVEDTIPGEIAVVGAVYPFKDLISV